MCSSTVWLVNYFFYIRIRDRILSLKSRRWGTRERSNGSAFCRRCVDATHDAQFRANQSCRFAMGSSFIYKAPFTGKLENSYFFNPNALFSKSTVFLLHII